MDFGGLFHNFDTYEAIDIVPYMGIWYMWDIFHLVLCCQSFFRFHHTYYFFFRSQIRVSFFFFFILFGVRYLHSNVQSFQSFYCVVSCAFLLYLNNIWRKMWNRDDYRWKNSFIQSLFLKREKCGFPMFICKLTLNTNNKTCNVFLIFFFK